MESRRKDDLGMDVHRRLRVRVPHPGLLIFDGTDAVEMGGKGPAQALNVRP
jgi:hypothetical protein